MLSTADLSIPCDDEDIQSTTLSAHGGEWPVFLSQIENGTGMKHTLLLDGKAARALRDLLSAYLEQIG